MSEKTVPIRKNTNQTATDEIEEPTMTIEKALRVIGYTVILSQVLVVVLVMTMFPELIF